MCSFRGRVAATSGGRDPRRDAQWPFGCRTRRPAGHRVPKILPASGTGCWPLVPIVQGDVAYLRGIELKLNHRLATVAAANHATYVDTYTASIGHDACQAPGKK